MSMFGDIAVNGFFLFQGEPNMKLNALDGFSNEPNAFNFLMGQPVCLDPHWEVTSVTYTTIVRRHFAEILSRTR